MQTLEFEGSKRGVVTSVWRQWLLATLTVIAGGLLVVGTAMPASASPDQASQDTQVGQQKTTELATQQAASRGATKAAASRRVCAPNGQCVTTSNYCYPDDGCGSSLYREANPGEYCSSSVGCITYKGRNYFYIGGPATTAAQRDAAAKCAASLGVTWLGAVAGGPVGITILGVAVSLWSCS